MIGGCSRIPFLLDFAKRKVSQSDQVKVLDFEETLTNIMSNPKFSYGNFENKNMFTAGLSKKQQQQSGKKEHDGKMSGKRKEHIKAGKFAAKKCPVSIKLNSQYLRLILG